ncbi:MAG: N-acetylglucosamine-6-phosphate deacetylase, partial [Candidatus Omnitrophica bacterium]|nr:N-acetylglucosamine-6-phosphate deacetylase [Candidatus Omnitrophota bacterium]
ECSLSYLDKVLKTCNGKLKMMTIAPELSAGGGSAMHRGKAGLGGKGALEIIKKLKKEKIIASFGHSDATFEETQKGIAAGINHATHLFNAMRSIHHRDPGPLPALLTDDRVSVQLIADGVHIHPEIIKLILKLKGVKNICLITDSMSSMGLPDGKYAYDGWNYESKDGACRYKDGTLIGTALPLNKIVKRMMEFTGISLNEALTMVTINPAKALGIHDRKGSIEEGKDADLVIMDEDLNVEMTIVGGEVVYEKSPLGL